MRGLEERAMTLYRQGKVPGSFYDGYGQEAVCAGAAFAMGPDDRLCVLHRDLAAHLIRGVTPARILGQDMGRQTGITGGRDGNVHFGDFRLGCVGMVSMLPDMMLVATGLAMAFKATRAARERALEGGGPTLIESVRMRMHGHAAHDDMKYVPKEQVEEWRNRDPIDRQETRLRGLGADVDALRAEVKAEVDAATEEALAAPMPDPASAVERVFCEGEAEVLGDGQAPWSGFRSETVASAGAVS